MSLQRQSRIACGIPECGAVAPWVPVDGLTPGGGRWAAWRVARALGWERDEFGEHCCPAHAPTDQRVERITELAALGLKDGVIGQRLGLSRGQVNYIRSTRGIAAGARPGRPRS